MNKHINLPRADAQSPARSSSAALSRDSVARYLFVADRLPSTQKMEALELLASGVAHDFNNALSVILGFAELLDAHVADDSTSREYVGEIALAGQNAAALMRQLLAFSGRLISMPRRLNLNELLRRSEDTIRSLVGEHVSVVISPGPDIDDVEADVELMEQVLANLALSARDAMPDGGFLRIATANVEVNVPTEKADVSNIVRSGAYVMISCRDTGAGVNEVARPRLFEPYFSAGTQKKGTGLRLASVYGIVRQAGGWVEVESAPGAGTTFTIFLPSLVIDGA